MNIINKIFDWVHLQLDIRELNKRDAAYHTLYVRRKWPLYTHRSHTYKYQKRVKSNV